MKFCFIVGFYPHQIGGAEYQARLIADNLKATNEIVFISYGNFDADSLEVKDGYKIYKLKSLESYHRYTLYHFVYKKIKRIILKEAPDKIYHRTLVPYTNYIIRFCYRNNIPFFLHVADNYSISFKKNIPDFLRKILLISLFKPIRKAKIIVQTEEQRRILKEMGVKADFKIPNLQYKGDYPSDNKDKILLWIGKSTPVKQLEHFISLANLYCNNVKFAIICRFMNDNYSNELVEKINKSSNIINLGEQSNQFINKYLQEKTFLLINTSSSEGFSNTFLQAWMRGVPVISLNSNPDNLFGNNSLGFYCNNSLENMKIFIDKYLNDTEKYLYDSKFCFEFSNNYFSIENQFDIFRAILES